MLLTAVNWSVVVFLTIFLSQSVPAQQPIPDQPAQPLDAGGQATITTSTTATSTVHTTLPVITTLAGQEGQGNKTRPATTTAVTTATAKTTPHKTSPTRPAAKTTQPAIQPAVKVDPGLAQKKLVALTFDDGPHKTLTPRLLDILQKQEVKATFFVVGSRAKSYPGIVKRAAAEGHQIGNHTYSHKDLLSLSDAFIEREIWDTANLIAQITGQRPTALRPPYGSYNPSISARAGAALVLWSVDPKDWDCKSAEAVFHNATRHVQDGDIILLHDIHSHTIQAVEPIITRLKGEGFTFVTVEELIAARGTLCCGQVYTACRH